MFSGYLKFYFDVTLVFFYIWIRLPINVVISLFIQTDKRTCEKYTNWRWCLFHEPITARWRHCLSSRDIPSFILNLLYSLQIPPPPPHTHTGSVKTQ